RGYSGEGSGCCNDRSRYMSGDLREFGDGERVKLLRQYMWFPDKACCFEGHSHMLSLDWIVIMSEVYLDVVYVAGVCVFLRLLRSTGLDVWSEMPTLCVSGLEMLSFFCKVHNNFTIEIAESVLNNEKQHVLDRGVNDPSRVEFCPKRARLVY
ncbi:hypothetical protein Tco_0753251, partial [Tanacetum coccineum]